jgi:alkanesulfonate monooxygenase SsuD/methylene tetrahydromethanopterin reductase-like flavin-dependent oxidoreductase (luciferase family)
MLWTQEVANYEGEFFRLSDAHRNPKPVQHAPRIWMGASGEQTALPLVAMFADGSNRQELWMSPSR